MKAPLTLQIPPQLPVDKSIDPWTYQSDLARWTQESASFLRSTPFDAFNYVYVPATSGAPTLTPQGIANAAPLAIDYLNQCLYYYHNGWVAICAGGGAGTPTPVLGKVLTFGR